MHRLEISSADIARMAGVSAAAVSNWRKRHVDFPAPVSDNDRQPRFDQAEVEAWLAKQGKLPAAAVDPAAKVWRGVEALCVPAAVADGTAALPALALLALAHDPTLDLGPQVEPVSRAVDTARQLLAAGPVGGPAPAVAPVTPQVATVTAGLCALARTEGVVEVVDALVARAVGGSSRSDDVPRRRAFAEVLLDLATAAAGEPVTTSTGLVDPACGGGTVLGAAADRGAGRLLGRDKDAAAAALARLRLAVRAAVGAPLVADLHLADSLAVHDAPGLADVAVVEPTFGDRSWHTDAVLARSWPFGPVPAAEPELAWVQHALTEVRPGGVVVAVMPSAAARRASGARLRRVLVDDGVVRAVVAMPVGVSGHHGVPVQVWLLVRPAHDPTTDEVLFVDASGTTVNDHDDVRALGLTLGELVRHRLPGRHAGAATGPTPGGGPAVALVPRAAIADDTTDLSPHGRVVTGRAADAERLHHAHARLADLLATCAGGPPPLPSAGVPSGRDDVQTVTVNDLLAHGRAFLRRGSDDFEDAFPEETGASAGLITGDDVRQATGARRHVRIPEDRVAHQPLRGGDVLVPQWGAVLPGAGHRVLPRVAAGADLGCLPGPGLLVLQIDPDLCDPWYVAAYLTTEKASRQIMGASGTRGSARVDLRRAELPLLPRAEQAALGADYRAWCTLRVALQEASRLVEHLTLGAVQQAWTTPGD